VYASYYGFWTQMVIMCDFLVADGCGIKEDAANQFKTNDLFLRKSAVVFEVYRNS